MEKIGFTGTRKGMTEHQFVRIHQLLLIEERHGPVLVIHGDCIGADADFHKIARGLGLQIRIRPTFKQRAYCEGADDIKEPVLDPLERNRLIVIDSDLMIATPSGYGEQRRSGTWATIRYARKIERHLVIVWPNGETTVENRTYG